MVRRIGHIIETALALGAMALVTFAVVVLASHVGVELR